MNAKPIVKIVVSLAILASLLLSGCQAAQYRTQPAEIRSVADKIAGYKVPAGYSEKFAADLMGYQVVSLEGATPHCHLYLVQAPKDTQADIDKLQERARSMEEGQRGSRKSYDARVVETRIVSLRGQTVKLAVSEGINSSDQPYREVTALFAGRGGPAMVSISSPTDQWDWDTVNTFLASIE